MTRLLPLSAIMALFLASVSVAQAKTTTPPVSAVAITSDPGTDDTHAPGDTIDVALTVAGGEVVRARRLEKDRNAGWEIHVTPDSNAAATVVLPATTDCGAEGAICTGDGRMLSGRVELTVVPKGRVDAVARQLSRPGNGSPIAMYPTMYPTSKSWR